MRISFGQLVTLLVLFGVSAWAIRWAGNRLRRVLEDPPSAAQGMLTQEEINAILASGLATSEALFTMSAKEQRVLAITAWGGPARGETDDSPLSPYSSVG